MLFIIRSAKIAEIQERRKSADDILNFYYGSQDLPGLIRPENRCFYGENVENIALILNYCRV
jgi:hypothetical protein